MCRRVTCSTCGKPDWAGCGAHVEAVLGDVPKSERCHCREDAQAGGQKQAPAPSGLRGAISALFGGKTPR